MYILHGYKGAPNGGWRPWLMSELRKQGIYACSLSLPDPERPIRSKWVDELARVIERDSGDDIYCVGGSLGATTILRYLEGSSAKRMNGAVLISSAISKNEIRDLDGFLEDEFDYAAIRSKCDRFALVHGDDDSLVPLSDAERLSRALSAPLTIVPGGKHLNSSAGWFDLPQALEALVKMVNEK